MIVALYVFFFAQRKSLTWCDYSIFSFLFFYFLSLFSRLLFLLIAFSPRVYSLMVMEASYFRLQVWTKLDSYHLFFAYSTNAFRFHSTCFLLIFFVVVVVAGFNDISGMLIRLFVVALLQKYLVYRFFLSVHFFKKNHIWARWSRFLPLTGPFVTEESIGLRWNWPLASSFSTLRDSYNIEYGQN